MPNVIKKYELILTEVETNNNKFWKGILYDDGTGASEWGRVGVTSTVTPYPSHQIVEKKMREKLKKGYTFTKTVSDSPTSTNGNSSVVKNADLHAIAKAQLVKSANPILSRLIDRLVQANVHRITSNTQITYNSTTGLFATPLGIVTMDGLVEARDLLAKIAPYVRKRDYGSDLNRLVSLYLRIIPQNVGMKLRVPELLPDDNAIQKQNDLIDSLESSYQALQTAPPQKNADGSAKPMEKVFEVDMDVLGDAKERGRLERWFEQSKKSMHHYDNIHVKEIFIVNVHDMTRNYDTKLGCDEEVWHGTSQANCLSILKSGLRTAPPSTAAIAGKLFGNGIYGAKSSSKSLGYTYGRWGQGSSGDTGWMFVCEFAMGRTYSTTAYGASCPSGYNSIWARASAGGLHNDELIVYKNNQCKIKYLLEVK